MTKDSYWDDLAKTPEEKDLLKRLRRLKLGKLCEFLYNDDDHRNEQEPTDTFASEVLYRVGYEIGHWYQDLEEYRINYDWGYSKQRYPDNITPAMIRSAKKWVYDAERILHQPRQLYFGGDF